MDIIMNEIESLLKRGINYFHVMNHSFSCDRNFVEKFCYKLIEKANYYDFAWSCFVIPSFFIADLDLLPLMVKAKLSKIEIGCESGSNTILSALNVGHTIMDIEKIVTKTFSVGIPATAMHFIIGSPKETKETLEETKDFVHKLLFLTGCFCDIHLHSYFPENDIFPTIYDTILRKRTNFIENTEYLTINELKGFKKSLQQEIIQKKKDVIKAPLKIKYTHYELNNKYKIYTQAYQNYISKSWVETLFRRKAVYKHIYFFWEIENNIDEYVPRLPFLNYIPQELLKDDYSNMVIVLMNLIRQGHTVGDLITIIGTETNNKINKNSLLQMLKDLEKNYPLYYTKYLK
jgi:hypothetical protein